MIMAAQTELSQLLNLRSCQFEAFPFTHLLPRMERTGVVAVMEYRGPDAGFALPAEGALPLALVVAVVLVSQGVIQNFHGHTEITTVEGTTQVLAGGPAAGQVAIKQLGTNGGWFFNVNSAHPFENSTPFNDFIELFSIVIIPFALAFTFGRMVKDRRQGRAVFAIMFVIWLVLSIGAMALPVPGERDSLVSARRTCTSRPGGRGWWR
jgi:potassium-transporting ATPase potassium-binding subunit